MTSCCSAPYSSLSSTPGKDRHTGTGTSTRRRRHTTTAQTRVQVRRRNTATDGGTQRGRSRESAVRGGAAEVGPRRWPVKEKHRRRRPGRNAPRAHTQKALDLRTFQPPRTLLLSLVSLVSLRLFARRQALGIEQRKNPGAHAEVP